MEGWSRGGGEGSYFGEGRSEVGGDTHQLAVSRQFDARPDMFVRRYGFTRNVDGGKQNGLLILSLQYTEKV